MIEPHPFLAVIPSLIGPLQALLALLPQILLGLAAFFTALFSVQSWRLRAQKAAQAAARNKALTAAIVLTLIALSYGGWWLYRRGVEERAKQGTSGGPTQPPIISTQNPKTGSSFSTPIPVPQAQIAIIAPAKLAWNIRAAGADFAPSPTVNGARVYLAAAEASALGKRSGFLACVNALDGKEVWRFQTERQVFSSPTFADGAVLIGEGLHTDTQTNLYCVDDASGQLRWKFAVSSHTESTPVVHDGRIYFGAGDEGVFCLDFASGKEIWHRKGWHVDSRAAVADGKVVVGSGYEPRGVVCLDAADGKLLWEFASEIPAWGAPCVVGDRVIIGLGNGDFDRAASSPEGALLALSLKDGAELWRVPMPDSVFTALAVENGRGYFGCRDGSVSAVDLASGKLLWQQSVGAPVLSSPTLVGGILFFGAHDGQVRALRASDGAPLWSFNARAFGNGARIFSSPAVADGRLFVGIEGGFVALSDLGSL